jgi:hypothetical protein
VLAFSVDCSSLRKQALALDASGSKRALLPQRLSGSHNPWGQAADLIDTWSVLEFFSAPGCVEPVKTLLGPDLILWDTQWIKGPLQLHDCLAQECATDWWPIDPAVGAMVFVDLHADQCIAAVAGASDESLRAVDCFVSAAQGPLWLARYMAASSRYVRSKEFDGNRRQVERCPLINYTNRPIWLVAGEDRAGNDFVSGFNNPVPTWATAVHAEI